MESPTQDDFNRLAAEIIDKLASSADQHREQDRQLGEWADCIGRYADAVDALQDVDGIDFRAALPTLEQRARRVAVLHAAMLRLNRSIKRRIDADADRPPDFLSTT